MLNQKRKKYEKGKRKRHGFQGRRRELGRTARHRHHEGRAGTLRRAGHPPQGREDESDAPETGAPRRGRGDGCHAAAGPQGRGAAAGDSGRDAAGQIA